MKQGYPKSCLVVLVLIAVVFLPAIVSTFCVGQASKDIKESFSNETSAQLIPSSRPAIPAELTEEAAIKSRAFLEFFKTPTKQLMPLGLYAMVTDMRDPKKLKELRRRGVILFHIYDGKQSIQGALGDLRSAREAGVGVLQNLPSTFLVKRSLSFWQNHISALAGNGQILAWYLPEETKPENLDRLEEIASIIRATDSMRRPLITYVCNHDPRYLRRVSGIVDAVIFGAYPSYYMPRPRADIKRRIDKAYESGVPVVVAGLEALKGRRNWTRRKDVRFDAYLSLISGAKGIMWYAYYYAKPRPELLEAVLEVATELNGPERLGEVLLLGKKPASLHCKLLKGPAFSPPASAYEQDWQKKVKYYDSIQWTAREHRGYLYIFAVNTAQKVEKVKAINDGGMAYAIKVKFGPISNASSKVHVVGEERTIDLSTGYFVDSFIPLGTHIYKVKLD